MEKKSITRETAINALRALAVADAIIARELGTSNKFRTDTIVDLEDQLGVTAVTKQQ